MKNSKHVMMFLFVIASGTFLGAALFPLMRVPQQDKFSSIKMYELSGKNQCSDDGKGRWDARNNGECYEGDKLKQRVTVIGGCDESLWAHTYHEQRLQVIERCASVTGIVIDASHGKNKDGCRHEADGDGHCFLKLDPSQEKYINEMNVKNENGMLVFEPECRYRVTQEDAKQACKNWKQGLRLAPIGAHVRITGAAVLDTQHGHLEIHPLTSIEVIH